MKRIKHRRRPKPLHLAQSTQLGLINQAGQGNTQNVRLKTVRLTLVQQLELCLSNCESLKRELALSQALVAAQAETIALLRGGA
jgi:hypothetical protein